MTKSLMGYVLSLLALSGCAKTAHHGPTRIDGHNITSYTQSISEIKEEMTQAQYEEFRLSLLTVQMSQRDRGMWSTTGNISPQVLAAVDGRTAFDIINMANVIRGAVPPGRDPV